MRVFSDHRRILTVVGVFLAVVLVAGGIWFVVARDGGGGSPAAVPPDAAVMTVNVYFHHGQGADPAVVVAVSRTVPRSPDVATAALGALLAGPTSVDRDAGYWSHFSAATAGTLRSVRIGDGVAHADFRDLRRIIPNASASAGSAALLAELDATLKQFGTAKTTVYSFDGSVDAFYEWLQMVPPTRVVPGPADARQAAREFVTTVVGLENPVDDAFRSVGTGLSEVDFRAQVPGDASPSGPVTTVSLRRDAKSWTVTGARTSAIRVDTPKAAQAIASPLAVSGRALAFEGQVTVRIQQVNGGTVSELGRGYVTGGGDALRPFSGQVTFTTPRTGSGWAVLTSNSGHNGETVAATAVPVTFTTVTAPPQVLDLRMTPDLPNVDGWVTLSGAGSVTFTLQASRAGRVQFFLTPTGTGTAPLAVPLADATRNGDRFTVTWPYRDEPMLAHLSAVITGPGGSTEYVPVNLYHT